MIKISVIIPIYNMGLYLAECLDSVMTQTLKDIEVICINDGSTDHSIEILQRYAAQYGNLEVLNQENLGVAKSRNNGINLAKGEYVAFMDPDDYYPANDILEKLYDNAKTNNVNICGGAFSSIKGGVLTQEYEGWRKDYTFVTDGIVKYEDYQFHFGFTRFIYNLEFLKRNNLYFPMYTRYEDPPFFVRAMSCAGEFYAMAQITYCYREGHKSSVTSLARTIDYARGVLDLVEMSVEQQLDKLYALLHKIVSMQFDDLFVSLFAYAASGSTEALELGQCLNDIFNLCGTKDLLEYVKEIRRKECDFVHLLQDYEEIIIYGAGIVGMKVFNYVNKVSGTKVVSFAVSELSGSVNSPNEIPITTIDELTSHKERALILIATLNNLHREIGDKLKELQFKYILPINYSEFRLFQGIMHSLKYSDKGLNEVWLQ